MEVPRYSVSPPWSFAVFVTTPIVRQPGFPEKFAAISSWLRGDWPTLKQQFAEERLVDRLAEELEPKPKIVITAKAER
jgi:hypothetical protein